MATFLISIFVLLMQFLWLRIDDIVGKGVEWYVILQLLFYVAASLVPMALPLAILLSSLMTFGNLGENYELVAFKSAGISLKRILRPLFVLILILSGVAFLFSNYWLPIANLKSKSLLYDVKEQKPTMDIRPGIFSSELDNFTIRVKNKKVIDDVEHLYDVMIYDHRAGNGNLSVITAEEGIMTMADNKQFLELKLFNGERYEEDEAGKSKRTFPLARSKFKENLIRFDLSQFKLNRTDEELFKQHYKMLNLSQLDASIAKQEVELDSSIKSFNKVFRDGFFMYSPHVEKGFNQVKKEEKLDYNHLVNDLNLPQKSQLYATATNMSRNTKSRLSSINGNIYSRSKFTRGFKIEWHKKLSLPFACVILFLIGAPLGAIIRKGGLGMPIVISVLFFLVFHILSTTGEKMAKEGTVEPIEGVWMASMILFPTGIFLTLKATSDSPLFKAEAYKNFFTRRFRKAPIQVKNT